jgi:cytochrome c553
MVAKRLMKTTLTSLLLPSLMSLALLPTAATAKGKAEAGMAKSLPCEACHGKDGRGIDPNYPVLAGQHQSYLVKALSDYRSGKRTNAIMAGMAAPLTNQDIEDLASFYSSMQGLQDLSRE